MWKVFLMIFPNSKRINRYRLHIRTCIVFVLVLSWPVYGMTQTGLGTATGGTAKKLHITADKLVSDTNANYIIFSGNVTTVYDDTVILSDQLKVFYQDMTEDQNRMGEENIKKIVATGHVSIRMGDRTAQCDQAVYTAETKTIVLTGEDTRIQSGTDYITGKKITIDRNTGRITVDGSPDKRVNAVFAPQGTKTPEAFNIDEDHDDTGAEKSR